MVQYYLFLYTLNLNFYPTCSVLSFLEFYYLYLQEIDDFVIKRPCLLKLWKGRGRILPLLNFIKLTIQFCMIFLILFRESITRGRKMNLSIEEGRSPILLWISIHARYHNMIELEVKTKLLQHCEKRVLQLSKELKVDDDEILEVPHDHISYNFSVLSEQEVQPRKKIRKKPTFEEINTESDFNLQFLWTVFKKVLLKLKKRD